MDSSKTLKLRRAVKLRVLAVLGALLVAAAAEGCARTSAEPATRRPAEARAPAAPAPSAPAPAAAASRPQALDPSEEITPEELAAIPEPVPASSARGRLSTPRAPAGNAREASQGDSARPGQAPQAGSALWRVQIFATQERGLADRTAGEAERLLGVRAHVVREGRQYKVRLGDYGTEDEAGLLRDQAIRVGYPGAFRIRTEPDTSLNKQ